MNEMYEAGFNVRVYGLLFANKVENGLSILLSKEFYDGPEYIKFPGGGLEFLEGPGTALVREFEEEVDLPIELHSFFHVSENFHKSYFRSMQLIALYWRVKALKEFTLPGRPVKMREGLLREQLLFWQPLNQLSEDLFANGSDKEVAKKIISQFNSGSLSL